MEYRHSKTLAAIASRDDRIKFYECDDDGHWFLLAPGYIEQDYGAHALRSDTVSGLRSKLYLIGREDPHQDN